MAIKKIQEFKFYVPILILVATIILVLLVAFNFYNYADSLSDTNLQKQGQIGDSFGVINSIASSIALVVVVISVFIQSRELKAQKDELELSRNEYIENRVTNIVYNQINKMDIAFDNFKIITRHHAQKELKGIDSFVYISEHLNYYFENNLVDDTHNLKDLLSFLSQYSDGMINVFGKSLRYLKVIDLVVSKSEIESQNKRLLKSLVKLNIDPNIVNIVDKVGRLYGKVMNYDASYFSEEYLNDFERLNSVTIDIFCFMRNEK